MGDLVRRSTPCDIENSPRRWSRWRSARAARRSLRAIRGWRIFSKGHRGPLRRSRGRSGSSAPCRRPPQRADQRGADRNYRGDQRDGYQGDPRAHQRDYYRGDQGYQGNGYRDGYRGDWRNRGAGPSHSWYRGDRLPPEYRSRQLRRRRLAWPSPERAPCGLSLGPGRRRLRPRCYRDRRHRRDPAQPVARVTRPSRPSP